MKKKLISMLAAAAMVMGCIPAMAAGSDMEAALITVKSRVDIPAELTTFESRTETYDGETTYSFEWSAPDSELELRITADKDGHIVRYYYYDDPMYSDGAFIYKPREEYYAAAEDFLKTIAPELFNTDDCLVCEETDAAITYNDTSFTFERRKNGIPVIGNNAEINLRATTDGIKVYYCEISWDYDTDFYIHASGTLVEPDSYYDTFPLELVYRKPFRHYRYMDTEDAKDFPELVYRFKDNKAGYISVYSGSVIEPETEIYNRNLTAADGKGAGDEEAALTPAEVAEVEAVKGTKTADEIIKAVSGMGVFGAIPSAESFNKSIYKRNGKYIVSLVYSDYDNAIDKPDTPVNVYIDANGQTGELLSISNYYYKSDYGDNHNDSEYRAARTVITGFLTKSFGGKLAECGEPVEDADYYLGQQYYRLVNGIKYDNNFLHAIYDLETGIITDFDQEWDDDTSQFTDPKSAIDASAATAKMEEYAPVHKAFVKSGDGFVLCYTSDGAYTELDAVTGDRIKPYSYDTPKTYSYTDISGHWAEDMIKAVAQAGAGLPGTEFLPDTEIKQEELLRMLAATGYYYSIYSDTDELYENAKDIITESEKAPDSPVLREDAFIYIARLMGFGKLAAMSDIFAPGFNDGTDVSPEKTGALAILRGYGIVKGDAGAVRPKSTLTRAEAASLIYWYLTTEK